MPSETNPTSKSIVAPRKPILARSRAEFCHPVKGPEFCDQYAREEGKNPNEMNPLAHKLCHFAQGDWRRLTRFSQRPIWIFGAAVPAINRHSQRI